MNRILAILAECVSADTLDRLIEDGTIAALEASGRDYTAEELCSLIHERDLEGR